MAKLISAKTGINATANGKNVDLKPSTTATGKGIELQIGANEGQTMSFTLDDMSADALGVGGSSVNLSTQESAKTATTTIDAAIKKVSAARGKMGAIKKSSNPLTRGSFLLRTWCLYTPDNFSSIRTFLIP